MNSLSLGQSVDHQVNDLGADIKVNQAIQGALDRKKPGCGAYDKDI